VPIRVQVPGRGIVEFPDGMSQQDMAQALSTLDTPAAEGPGYASAAWEGLKNLGVGGLELLGRPGEFISGTVGGALQTGSLIKGLQRGTAALLEPDLVNSQIRESMSKVIEQEAPQFAKAQPGLTAALGFVGDVVTDPTNLLGGAGIIRRGGISALKGLGASEKAAKAAMLVPVGEAFSQRLVAPAGKALTRAAAATKLGEVFPSLRMRTLTAPGRTEETAGFAGLTGQQVSQTLGAQERAALHAAEAQVEKIFKGVSPEDRERIAWATAYAESPQAAQVAADPKLRDVLAKSREAYRAALNAEQAAGIMPVIRPLNVGTDVEQDLKALSQMDRTMLEKALREGTGMDPSVRAYLANPRHGMVRRTGETKLEQLAYKLDRKMVREDEGLGLYYFADPETVSLLDTGKVNVAEATKNYLPTDIPQPSAAIMSTRPRYTLDAEKAKSMTLAKAVKELGAETDAAVLLRNRLLQSARAQANTKRVQVYAAEFGKTAPAKGYRTLTPTTLKSMPDELSTTFKSVYLPTDVANELERYMTRVMSPDLENGLRGLFQRATRLWKTMATSLGIPAFHANNFLGNSVNMYAGGDMSPGEVATGIWNSTRAIRALALGRTPERNLLGPVRIGKTTYTTDAEIIEQARMYGAIGGQAGSFGVEIGKKTPTGSATLLGAESGVAKVLNPDWEQYQKLRNVNQQYIEDPAKLALFVHELRKGKSAEQASVTVRKVLFDYDELSEAERNFRTYVPFYTWMRKNIPLQMATMVERPAKISHQGQFLNALREWTRLSGGDVPELAELPTYMQTGEYTALPMQGEKGSPVTARVRLPWFDVGIVDPTNIPRTLAERVSPLIRVPYALTMGTDPVTGQRVEGMRKSDFLGRFLPTGLGGAVETEQGLQQTARAKQVTGAIPVPFGAPLRALFPDEDAEILQRSVSGLPLEELILRSLGAAPRVVTPEVLQQAREERKRNVQKAKAAAKQARYFDKY